MSILRDITIGNARLLLGDCRLIAPMLPRPAAVISDPPYGQRQNTNVVGRGGMRAVDNARRVRSCGGGLHSTGIAVAWPDAIHGDAEPFDPEPWLDAADIVCLWGAHKFADRLPPGRWLVWDKVPTGKVRDQGDGEAAWINSDGAMRIYRLLWDGVCVGSAARHEVTAGQQRVHPTQKPEALCVWTIEQARVPAGGTILDPYAGSGSTIVAAVTMGYPAIGIEIEPRYYETMLRRVEAAQRQGDLLRDAPSGSEPYPRWAQAGLL